MNSFLENEGPCQFTYEDIITLFNLKIKKSLQNTEHQNREDLEQEIKIKIYEKMHLLNNIKSPGFFDFLEDNEM